MFQGSMADLGGSRGSPIALALSVAAEGLSTSDDGCLYSGAEPDGDVSPDTLFWLIPPRHTLCDFAHWWHFGYPGSHLIFFSRQVKQACASRFRGLPALVMPHEGLTASPSIMARQYVPSS